MAFVNCGRGLIGVVALALGLLGALPVRAADSAAPYNWNGFYVGGFTGGAFGGDVKVTDRGGAGFGSWNDGAGHSWKYNLGGSFIGGGQLGYNFHIAPVVLGLDNEVGYINLKGSRIDPKSFGLDTSSRTELGSWFDVVSGRVGFPLDRWLIYGKGGVAFSKVASKVVDACNTGRCGFGLINASGSDNVVSAAGGGGVEYAITNNLTYKLEYLFINVGSSFNATGRATAAGNPLAVGQVFVFKHDVNGIHGVHSLKLGINYKF